MKLIKTVTIKYEMAIRDRLASYDNKTNEEIIALESNLDLEQVFNDLEFCDEIESITVDTKVEE